MDVGTASGYVPALVAEEGDWAWAVDTPIPRVLRVGNGSALFIAGWVYHRFSPLKRVAIQLGQRVHRVHARSMPRLDVYLTRHRTTDRPPTASYTSAFWTIIPVPSVDDAVDLPVMLSARNAAGEVWQTALDTLRVVPADGSFSQAGRDASLVAICMATYNPDLDLFRAQVASIRRQTHDRWLCVISDDLSHPDLYAAVEREVADDARFHLIRGQQRVGIYFNFERALRHVPANAGLVALADQDDVWHPEKLAVLNDAMTRGATLAYSDQRLTSRDGTVIADTFWVDRDNQWTDLKTMLLANTVTGASALFRAEILDLVLPFPPHLPGMYHDHWIALAALASGDLSYVHRPLYDYVQHSGQALGHALSRPHDDKKLDELTRHSSEQELMVKWQRHYFERLLPQQLMAMVLLERVRGTLRTTDTKTLERAASGDTSWAGWLSMARGLGPRRARTTLGYDRDAILGGVWRRVSRARTRRGGRPYTDLRHAVQNRHLTIDYGPQAELPRRHRSHQRQRQDVADIVDVTPQARRHMNLIVARGDETEELAVEVAVVLQRAGMRPRLVAIEDGGGPVEGWSSRFQSDAVADLGSGRLQVSPSDAWVAASWPAARAAHTASQRLGSEGFLYLLDLQRPTNAGEVFVAEATYELRHRALFAGEPVREHFRARRLGVYLQGDGPGDAISATFQPPIPAVEPPTEVALRARTTRRLAVAARTAGEVEFVRRGICEAIERGTLDDSWELWASPSVDPTSLSRVLGRAVAGFPSQTAWRKSIPFIDVALVVGCPAPPGREAVTLAAAGAVVVIPLTGATSPDYVTSLSGNFVPAEGSVDGLVTAIAAAFERTRDVAERAAGLAVPWARTWDAALPLPLVDRIRALLDDVSSPLS